MVSTPLSDKLRALRLAHWPDGPVKQARVADALGVRPPSISAYENGTAVPPIPRLHDYAVFFASRRWLEPDSPTRVSHDDLDPDEHKAYLALRTELTAAAAALSGGAVAASRRAFWEFPTGEPVRIFCGRLDKDDAGEYGDPDNPNYIRFRNAADLDALIELWGHLWRHNPTSDIRIRLGNDFNADDLNCHVVILGNIAQEQGTGRLIPEKTLPVRQVHVDGLAGEVFEVDRPDGTVERHEPWMDGGRVLQDVGLLARVPSPHHTDRTLTVCSGVFTRGVFGAVRATTADPLAADNAAYLDTALEDVGSFAMLIRVRVAGVVVPTPDLRDDESRLYVS